MTTLDVHADYTAPVDNIKLTFGVDVFNLFNSQHVLQVIQNSEIDNRTYSPRPNQDFLLPEVYQDARAVRFLAKVAF